MLVHVDTAEVELEILRRWFNVISATKYKLLPVHLAVPQLLLLQCMYITYYCKRVSVETLNPYIYKVCTNFESSH